MAKKVYLVTFDSYEGTWGMDLCCGGIYMSRNKAEEVANSLQFGQVHEVKINTETRIHLGGYCE